MQLLKGYNCSNICYFYAVCNGFRIHQITIAISKRKYTILSWCRWISLCVWQFLFGGWRNCSCNSWYLENTDLARYSSVPMSQGTQVLCHISMYQKGRILEFLPLLQRQELQLNCFLLGTLVHHAVSELLMCHGLSTRGSSLLDLVFFC